MRRWFRRHVGWIASMAPCIAPGVSAQETITFHADQTIRPFVLRSGFLHGRDNGVEIDPDRVIPLHPAHWRVAKFQGVEDAITFGADITYALDFIYVFSRGGYRNVNVWEDWEGWEEHVITMMDWLDPHVEWWDVWNEPDGPGFWHGTYEQSLELFARTINIIKAHDPNAKVVGPSISRFRPGGGGEEDLIRFITDLDRQYGVRLDALSWHELGGPAPNRIAVDARIIRQGLADNFPPDYQPRLHVNEFAGSREHLSPGWNLGYLFWLEIADVDASMRACWKVRSFENGRWSSWDDCWAGLNGLLMRDNTTPTHTWWFHREWANLEGDLIGVAVPSATTVGIAVADPSGLDLHALVSRFDKGYDADLRVAVEGYGGERVQVVISRIPNNPDYNANPPIIRPLPDGPEFILTAQPEIIDGRFEIIIPQAADGAVYVLDIRLSGGDTCQYTLKKDTTPRGGCETCPSKGDVVASNQDCEKKKECDKKLKGRIPCPDGGIGFCKRIKGKRDRCG